MRTFSPRLGLLAVLLGVSGCSSCDDDRAVPFKREGVPRGSFAATGPAAPDASAMAQQQAASAPGPGRGGSSYPEGTTQVELGGRGLAVSQGGAIRAGLDVDLNADGQPELLLVTQDADGRPALQYARPEGRGWAPPEGAQDLLGGDACTLRQASLELLSAAYAVAEADLDCAVPAASVESEAAAPALPAESAQAGLPPPPSPPAPPGTPGASGPTRAERQLWIIALERPPRLVERVATVVPSTSSALRVDAAVRSRDLDADQHADLVLALEVRGGDQPETAIALHFLSRAGGLSLDAAEPEQTLLALADRAKRERKGNAARAGELARKVLALHGALCAESGSALVRLGSAQGLPCGASLAAGRAASIESAVLASQGRLLEAIASYQSLDSPAYRLTDNDWERARYALSSRTDAHTHEFHKGPIVALPAAPAARRSAIAFLDEQRILLRTEPASSYDLESGQLAPIGMPGSLLHRDPSGRYALAAIVRSCQGYHLSIVDAARVVAGVVAGPSVSEPLVVQAPPPPGARCPELSTEQRRDDGGLRALEWTSQGVLIARGQTLLLLPLDASARAEAPARELARGAAIAGLPPHASEITPDGRFQALLTPIGVAVHDRRANSTRLIALPQGAGKVSDIALSPSGKRIAVVQGRRLLVGTARVEPTTATAVAPAGPSGTPPPP